VRHYSNAVRRAGSAMNEGSRLEDQGVDGLSAKEQGEGEEGNPCSL
jgi:hypothetical protein